LTQLSQATDVGSDSVTARNWTGQVSYTASSAGPQQSYQDTTTGKGYRAEHTTIMRV